MSSATTITKAIVREYFDTELHKSQEAIATRDFETAWIGLQRAHILGQREPWLHIIAHWEMLKLAWRQRDPKEAIGQSVFVCFACLFLLFGFGRKRSLRTGRVNVDSSERMSVPEDLLRILSR